MKVIMKAQGVWCTIEQKDPKGAVDEKIVQVALAAIYQGVPEDVLLSIADKETAKEAWEVIKMMCMGVEKVKEAKVQTLKGEFSSLIMKEMDKIEGFCMKLSEIVTNIRVLGEIMEESGVVRKILRAIPDKFHQIASNIEQFGDVKGMTVEEVVGRFKAHEERMKGRSESVDGQLLLTSLNQRPRGGSFRDKGRIKCYNCNTMGHYAAECDKPQREREKRQEVNLVQIEDDEPKDPKGAVDEKIVQVALAAIYQGVPEDVLLSIAEKETAKETWEAIKMMCMGVEKVKEAKV
ncbi:uncharacterized protein LOC141695582 [Apium graveolens]|uniref:uncharacterized protein LOC141695582 n=1 Tax=Apium graveolens TaxID=4045 RepID=UPI003D7BC04E